MISEILGQNGTSLFKELEFVVQRINAEPASFEECVLSPDELLALPQAAQFKEFYLQVIWGVYVASASAILRADIWSRGLVDAYAASNYFSFCANFRGLIESTADTYYSFDSLPNLLSLNFAGLKSTNSNGNPVPPRKYEVLCDKLSHFIHAQNQKGNPDRIKLVHSKEYMKNYQQVCPGVVDLYNELCQVVHPSAHSLYWMIKPDDGAEKRSFFIGTSASATQIIAFIDMHKNRILFSMIDALSKPLVCLKILSLLRIPSLKLDFMGGVNLNPITGWPELERHLDL